MEGAWIRVALLIYTRLVLFSASIMKLTYELPNGIGSYPIYIELSGRRIGQNDHL